MVNENLFLESFEFLVVGSDWKKLEEFDLINVLIFVFFIFKIFFVDYVEEFVLGKVRVLNLIEFFYLLSV